MYDYKPEIQYLESNEAETELDESLISAEWSHDHKNESYLTNDSGRVREPGFDPPMVASMEDQKLWTPEYFKTIKGQNLSENFRSIPFRNIRSDLYQEKYRFGNRKLYKVQIAGN